MLGELPILSVNEVIERIDAVSIADVRQLAAELFDPRRLSVAGVGPEEERFRAAIEPLAGEPAAAGSHGALG